MDPNEMKKDGMTILAKEPRPEPLTVGEYAPRAPQQEKIALQPVDMPLRFSERMQIAIAAVEWCKQRNVPPVAHNIITAVQALKLMQRHIEKLRDR